MKKYSKKDINKKLEKLGWMLPVNTKYKGMLKIHTVQCTTCGSEQPKRMDNLIYREELCTNCFNTSMYRFNNIDKKLDELSLAFKTLWDKMVIETSKEKPAKNTVGGGLKTVFQKYVSRAGFKRYNRKMQSDEWFRMSHDLAEELMKDIAWDEAEFAHWETFYTDILSENPNKQGQDIVPLVIPIRQHQQAMDKIKIRTVQL